MKTQNYNAWNIEPLSDSSSAKKSDLYFNIASFGILAPNSHNSQPWRFSLRLRNNTIDISVDPAKILRASDAKGRQASISVGCATENIRLAGEYYGLNPIVEFHGADRLARVIFKNISPSHREQFKIWISAMKSRRMNRAKYDGKYIPDDIVNEIKNSCEDDYVKINLIRDTATKLAVSEIQYFADRAVIALPKFRKELADYLLPNDTESYLGMPGATFGLSDELAEKIHRELSRDGMFNPDWAVGFGIAGRDGIKSSPVLCIITVKEDTPELWIKAGMLLERIALICEINRVNIAVHAQMVEVEALNKMLKLRLRSLWRPTVICRLGYSTEERPHSPRAEVSLNYV